MPEIGDLYEILQIHPTAQPEVVEAAYRRLARIYHPDVNPDPDAPNRMKELNIAYEALSDPESRERYDRDRTSRQQRERDEEQAQAERQSRAEQSRIEHEQQSYVIWEEEMQRKARTEQRRRSRRTDQQSSMFSSDTTPFRRVVEQIDRRAQTNKEKGDLFEYLVQGLLETDPIYKLRFRNVWLWYDWPGRNNRPDTGVDIVAVDNQGQTVAIQCKYRNNPDAVLNRNDISEYISELATRAYDKGVIFSTAKDLSTNAKEHLKRLEKSVEHVGFSELEDSPFVDWTQFDVSCATQISLSEVWLEIEREKEKRQQTPPERPWQPSVAPPTNVSASKAGQRQRSYVSPSTDLLASVLELPAWVLLSGVALLGLLLIAGVLLFVPGALATLVTWLLALFRVVVGIILAAMILGALYVALKYEPELGIVGGIGICVIALVLLSVDGAKVFLDRYLSEEYAAFLFLGGLVVAIVGGIRKASNGY